MRGTRLSALVLAASLLAAATVYAQVDISGTWEVTFESPQGPATIEATFKQVGESVDGSITTPLGTVDFTGALINSALTMSSGMATHMLMRPSPVGAGRYRYRPKMAGTKASVYR